MPPRGSAAGGQETAGVEHDVGDVVALLDGLARIGERGRTRRRHVTDDLVAALNQRVPSVQTTPPAGWRPRQESLATQQTVSQVLLNVAQQQAAQQQQQAGQQPAQQQQPAQPSGR